MHPTRLPPRSLALLPGLGTDGGVAVSFPLSSLLPLLFRYYFVTTHSQPRFPWAACRCCIFFILCVHLFCPVPVYFPGRFVLFYLIFCGARVFLICSVNFLGPYVDCTVPRASMSGSWCLGVPRGASEPWHRRAAAPRERAKRVPANTRRLNLVP